MEAELALRSPLRKAVNSEPRLPSRASLADLQGSVLTPQTRSLVGGPVLSSRSSATTQRVKDSKPPTAFNPEDDIHLWILEVNDYFELRQITDPYTQATCAGTYLNSTMKKRINQL